MEDTTVVRFRLLEPLSRTPACQVWRAHDESAGHDVAVKVLNVRSAADEAHAERFQREARVAASLGHRHIVGVLDTGVSYGRPYVTMPLMEGGDLRAALADGPLSAKRAVTIVEHVAAALDAARQAGLVHGGVKPSNVLFDGDGVALLTDFGAARGTDRDDADTITSWGYFAPEYLITGRADARTDVYALTGLLYFCFTGLDPFGGTIEEQHAAHRLAPPPRPTDVRPGLPGALDAVIATGMAKDPELRYPTARALARAARMAFRRAQAAQQRAEPTPNLPARRPPMQLALPPATPGRVAGRRPRRLVYGASALVLAAVTAIAAGMTYLSRDHPPPAIPSLDGMYTAEFGSTLTLDGASPSDADATMLGTTFAVRSTCPTDGCVAVAQAVGTPLTDGAAIEKSSATDQFVLDAVDGAWVSVTSATDAKGGEQWRVLSLTRDDDGGLTGSYFYVGEGRGAQRPVTLVRTGDVPDGQGPEDPATLPPRSPSPALDLRGEYMWTRSAVKVTVGKVNEPVEVIMNLRTFTNCLRTGDRCFSLLANRDGVGILLTYADGTWTFHRDRELQCDGGGVTRAVWTFELPMPPTVPNPIMMLEGGGHMENTGDCNLSADTEIKLQRLDD